MQQMSSVKRLILCAVCVSLCVVLPQAFHAIPNAGAVYCPMHIPVLLCGLICGWGYGLLCGVSGVLLSSLLTGMPPVAVLPAMLIECAVYGAVTGIMMKIVCTKKVYADLYISLITAMVTGRVVSGLAKAFIFSRGSYSLAAWATGSFVVGLPGIIVHLALLPTVVFALMKANLVPCWYYDGEKKG